MEDLLSCGAERSQTHPHTPCASIGRPRQSGSLDGTGPHPDLMHVIEDAEPGRNGALVDSECPLDVRRVWPADLGDSGDDLPSHRAPSLAHRHAAVGTDPPRALKDPINNNQTRTLHKQIPGTPVRICSLGSWTDAYPGGR